MKFGAMDKESIKDLSNEAKAYATLLALLQGSQFSKYYLYREAFGLVDVVRAARMLSTNR